MSATAKVVFTVIFVLMWWTVTAEETVDRGCIGTIFGLIFGGIVIAMWSAYP